MSLCKYRVLTQGPAPPVNASCRIFNELLYQLKGPQEYFIPLEDISSLCGVEPFLFGLYYGLTTGSCPRLMDLREIWKWARWCYRAQLHLFNIENVKEVAPGIYDILDVLEANGWESETHYLR